MPPVMIQPYGVFVPGGIVDRAAFHRWAASDEFPRRCRVDYLQDEVWIALDDQNPPAHDQIIDEVACVLVEKTGGAGAWFGGGCRVEHPRADISVAPDGGFIMHRSFRTGRVRPLSGWPADRALVQGSPDMVLEVVSANSWRKDTEVLRRIYWQAGVREYWLVDARREHLRLSVLRRTSKGYVAAPSHAGWHKSSVFRKSFRLTQRTDALGHPEYTLSVR